MSPRAIKRFEVDHDFDLWFMQLCSDGKIRNFTGISIIKIECVSGHVHHYTYYLYYRQCHQKYSLETAFQTTTHHLENRQSETDQIIVIKAGGGVRQRRNCRNPQKRTSDKPKHYWAKISSSGDAQARASCIDINEQYLSDTVTLAGLLIYNAASN